MVQRCVVCGENAEMSPESTTQSGPRDKGVWARFDWWQFSIFILMHIACLGVFWTGWSPVAVATAACVYGLQVFGITAFYHRCFAHRAFKTSRAMQLAGAVMGNMAMQRGALWWVSKHRRHHQHADTPEDAHSPRDHGLLWSHMVWFMECRHSETEEELVADLAKFPELRFLDRHPFLVPMTLAGSMFAAGAVLAAAWPTLGTGPWQMLLWGWLIPTMAMNHVTFCVNSVAHRFGTRRFDTRDESRNNLLVALLTFGEGWHNNHHRYPSSARQGFYWWELDVTYCLLRCLSWIGLVWDLKPVPQHVLEEPAAGGLNESSSEP